MSGLSNEINENGAKPSNLIKNSTEKPEKSNLKYALFARH